MPIGPPMAAAATTPEATPCVGLGPLRCSGRSAKSLSAGSTAVRPGITRSPIDSRWARAAPQLEHLVASGAAGVAHHGHVAGSSPDAAMAFAASGSGGASATGSGFADPSDQAGASAHGSLAEPADEPVAGSIAESPGDSVAKSDQRGSSLQGSGPASGSRGSSIRSLTGGSYGRCPVIDRGTAPRGERTRRRACDGRRGRHPR